jgi:hypothetical protein
MYAKPVATMQELISRIENVCNQMKQNWGRITKSYYLHIKES